jgi:hypothetical protein
VSEKQEQNKLARAVQRQNYLTAFFHFGYFEFQIASADYISTRTPLSLGIPKLPTAKHTKSRYPVQILEKNL